MNNDYDLSNEDAETIFECERMAKLTGLTPQMVYELWTDYSEIMFAGWIHGMGTMTAYEFQDNVDDSLRLRYRNDPDFQDCNMN